MDKRGDFPRALRRARAAKGLTQEDFSDTSSRTYVSMLERGVRSPTLAKINELCETLDIRPLTLLALAYAGGDKPTELRRVLSDVESEALQILEAKGSRG